MIYFDYIVPLMKAITLPNLMTSYPEPSNNLDHGNTLPLIEPMEKMHNNV